MKVEIKNDPNEPTKEEVIEAPAENGSEPAPAPAEADKLRALELENAELRGRASALKDVAKPSDTGASQNQWKAIVMSDMNSLSDEDFKTKYKYEKYQATAAILEQDHAKTKQEVAELRAEQRAEQRVVSKYKDFYEFKSEIDDMVSQASFEVRQDPEKLAKFLERAYLAASSGKKSAAPVAKGEEKPKGEGVKRIVSNFEKPTPSASGASRSEAASDELPEDIRSIGKAFKITSEKERQELLKDDYVPVELGAGLVFRHPDKGVEKVA